MITDIKMPEMDGIDAANEICRDGPTPIILVSAYHDEELLSRAREGHVLAYLVKPIEKRDLGNCHLDCHASVRRISEPAS